MTSLTFFLLLSLGTVLLSLGYGLLVFIKNPPPDQIQEYATRSNKAMQWRVILQGIALFIFFLLLYCGSHP